MSGTSTDTNTNTNTDKNTEPNKGKIVSEGKTKILMTPVTENRNRDTGRARQCRCARHVGASRSTSSPPQKSL
jgi:hypothetical protein